MENPSTATTTTTSGDVPPDPKVEALTFLEKKGIKNAKILFACISGSHAYNLNIEGSDYDTVAVYVAPLQTVLSLPQFQVPSSVCATKDEKPDVTAYEVGKFCELLLLGNPRVIQLLFTTRMCYETEEWLKLKQHSKSFLTQTVVNAYLGYAKSELKQMEGHVKYGYSKPMYHALRLLMEIETILCGGAPRVFFEDEDDDNDTTTTTNNEECKELAAVAAVTRNKEDGGKKSKRQLLLEVRRAQDTRNAFLQIVKQYMDRIEALKKTHISKLPSNIDAQLVNDYLVNIRLHSSLSQQQQQ